MPHVIVKLWPGELEQQKKKLAAEITKAVVSTLHYGEEAVSVAMEEVKATDWTEKVYSPISLPSATRSTNSRATNRNGAALRLAFAVTNATELRHPPQAALRPDLPHRTAQQLPFVQRADPKGVGFRIFGRARIHWGSAVLAERMNAPRSAIGRFDVPARATT
jgi:4-oxalocrotonate tautomerase